MNDATLFRFRLYVADDAHASGLATDNLTALCQNYLPDRHQIEVVDVLQQPAQALADRITLTPTLIKFAPLPVCRIVGTLEHTQAVLEAIGLGTQP